MDILNNTILPIQISGEEYVIIKNLTTEYEYKKKQIMKEIIEEIKKELKHLKINKDINS